VLPAVSDQYVLLWQRRGAELLGQRNLTRKGGGQGASRRRDCRHHGGREPGSGGRSPTCRLAAATARAKKKSLTGRTGGVLITRSPCHAAAKPSWHAGAGKT